MNLFPDFDDNLRQAFQRETELFFDSIVREDRSVLDLLTADYTFVNERLAKHYGIPNVYGPQFRRVTLPAGAGHAPRPAGQGRAPDGDLAARPHLAGVARQVDPADVPRRQPAGPPPNVPALKERPADATGNAKAPTMREKMEEHHANPACATCHKIMDPLGLALENFDAVGAWRTHGRRQPDRRHRRAGRRHEGRRRRRACAMRWCATRISSCASSPRSC